MKLVWHIFVKDLHRLGAGVLLWSGLFVLQFVGYHVMRPVQDGVEPSSLALTILNVFWGLQWLVLWLLVAGLIHGDPLLSDRAAWRTRPISGGRLFAAKFLALVLLFGVWPSLLTLPWWIDVGFSVGETARILCANAVGSLSVAGIAATVAALTPDLLRYIGWSVVLAAAGALAVFSISANMSVPLQPPGTITVLIMRLVLVAVITAFGVGAILTLQYLRRAFRRALTVAGLTAITAGLAAWAWPWNAATVAGWFGGTHGASPTVSARVEGVTLFVPPSQPRAKATLQLSFAFSASDLPRGDGLSWEVLDATLRHGEHGRLPLKIELQGYWRASDETRQAAVELMAGRGAERVAATDGATARLDLPSAIAPRLRVGAATLHGTGSGGVWHGSLEGMMPFREGASAAAWLEAIRLVDIRGAARIADPGHYVKWVEAGPLYRPERLLQSWGASHNPIPWRESEMVLRGRGATWTLQPSWRFRRDGMIQLAVGAVGLAVRVAEFYPESMNGSGWSEPGDPTRFDDAMLARVVFRQVAPVAASIDAAPLVPDLVIESDLTAALARADAEGKHVLVIANGRDYDPVAQALPFGWHDARVRELLRKRFICVQVFGNDDPRFARRYKEEALPKFVALTPRGAVQDTWGRYLMPPRWEAALTAVDQGRTYLDVLREEAARKPDDRQFRMVLANALLARGDVAEGVDVLMSLTEPISDVLSWRDYGGAGGPVGWRLRQMASDSAETRTALRQVHDRAVARLAREPQDAQAAQELLLTVSALSDRTTWSEFPRLLPAANPTRWALLARWILQSNPKEQRPLPPDAVPWESFLDEGRALARQQLRAVPATAETDRATLSNHWRHLLWQIGLRGVQVLVNAGEADRAQRLGVEVLKLAGVRSRDTRAELNDILRGRARPDTLREVEPPSPVP
jgi:hypothetical protein